MKGEIFMLKKFFLCSAFFISLSCFAQDAFFNVSMGPDFVIKNPDKGAVDGTRFRLELELGGKNFSFVFQPSFGSNTSSIYMGPRMMLPLQVGSQPLFVVPDCSVGPEFSFSEGNVALGLDFKFGVRLFYELQEGMGISFRPVGFALKTFNVWFGDAANQVQLGLRYEMLVGFVYFF
jgi:hypothetical protein